MLTGGDDDYGKEQRHILLDAYEQIRTFDMTTMQLIEPLRGAAHDSLFRVDRAPLGRQRFKWRFLPSVPSTIGRSKSKGSRLQLEKVQYHTTDLYR